MNDKLAKKARRAAAVAIHSEVSPEWAQTVFTAAGLTPRQQRRAVEMGIRKLRKNVRGLTK